MVLLSEKFARAKADVGHSCAEPLFHMRKPRPELHQPDAVLVSATAQLRFARRLQTQAFHRDRVELCPLGRELAFQAAEPLLRSFCSPLSNSRVPSIKPCSSIASALNTRA